MAVGLYLEDKLQQNCAEDTLTKLKTLFETQFAGWARNKGLLYLVEVALDHPEEFRKSWKDKSPKRTELYRAFSVHWLYSPNFILLSWR